MSEPAGLPTDLIGLAEAAKLLPGVRPGKCLAIGTLYRWTTEGRLPFWRVGRHRFVSRSDVRKLAVPGEPRLVPAVERGEEHAQAMKQLAALGLV